MHNDIHNIMNTDVFGLVVNPHRAPGTEVEIMVLYINMSSIAV